MELQKLQRRKTRARNEGNLEQLALACAKLGEYYFRHERYEDALREYKEEAEVNEALGNTLSVGVSNRMIGEVYTSMENYEKALEHQNIHLEVAISHENQVEEQRALATIGRTYFCKAESLGSESPEYESCLAEAKKAYMRSLNVCERLSGIGRQQHMEMRARLLLNIGLVRECQQEVQQGIECIQKAIHICKEHDLFEDLFRCYSSLGMLYHRQGESRKALSSLGLALEVASRLEDKVQLSCETLLNKAEVLFGLPDFHGAKQVLIKAYKLKTPIPADRKLIEKHLRIATVMCKTEEELLRMQDEDLAAKKKLYEKMGDCCIAVKNYTKALEYYHKMRECSEALGETGKELAAAYVSLSQTYKDNQQYDLALQYFEKELQLWKDNPAEACNTMLNIGEVQELNLASYDKLEDIYTKAHKLAIEASSVKLEKLVLEALAKVQRAKGRNELAEQTEAKLQLLPAEEGSESENSEDEINLDIGHDVCLDELTDSGSENEDTQKSRQRRRPQRLRIRRNEKGETQLHVACMNGNLALVKRLIEQGHPVNIRDHCGWLPLHEASNHGHRDIVEHLLDKGANINDRGGTQCGGVTPLHDAASCGNLGVIELLLDRGASIVMRTDEGDTPLDCLLKWYARSDTKFDPVGQAYFDEIRGRLKKALEKAGHQVQDLPQQQQRQKSTQQRSLSRSQKKQPSASSERRSLRDNLDLGNLSEEESPTNRRPSYIDTSSPENSPRAYRELEDNVYRRDKTETGAAAREEYCNVMKMLRKKTTANDVPKQVPKPAVQDNQGFLEEEEVGEDWLEDDLPQNTRPMKKRKITALGKHRQEFMSGTGMRQSSTVNIDEPLFSTNVSSHQTSEETMDTTGGDDFAAQETAVPDMENNRLTETGSNGDRSSTERLSLFDTGFTSQRSTLSISTTPHLYRASESPRGPLAIKVRIEDKLLLVPLRDPENLSIQWLAKEAAKRYYSLEGVKPTLKLLTKEGALLDEDDPLSLIVNTDEVISMVTSWNIPALTERYAEACHNCGAEFDVHLNNCLEACQATQTLHLSDLALTPSVLTPVFRSLNRQHTLHQLHLGGNLLCDEGVKLLTECLPTLSHLRELDISCCNITADGIGYLNSMFSNPTTSVLQHLTALNLSHNPIGDESMKYMSNILSRLVSLSKLYLQACDFSPDCCRIPTMDGLLLCLDAVEELDISYNKLGQRGLSGFLGRLNPARLRRLSLAATWSNKSDSLATEVALFLEKDEFEHLNLLDLSDCHLNDDDIWNLLRTLQRVPSLETLKLCCNPELSSVSLRRLIQHKPAIGSIDLVGCHGMGSNFEGTSPHLWLHESMCPTRREQKGIQSLTLSDIGPQGETEFNIVERMWRLGWESRAMVQRGPGGLLCLTVNQ